MGYKIGIDVGGTFTDLVYTGNDKDIKIIKTSSTPENQARGVIDGLRKIAENEKLSLQDLLKQTEIIIHGSTVATNTMLEFNGARTGLITSKGFRDDIELRRGYKERIFDPRYPAPTPIVLRRHRLTVDERIDREGRILMPLDEDEAAERVRSLRDAGVESIAVCFIFGFLNPEHEKKVAKIIAREHPNAFISLSHEVLPQIREFERVSTTLVNAYTGPKLKRYLTSLQSDLQSFGFRSEFFVMLSGGGIMNAQYAAKYAVFSLLSGPAGGVVACQELVGEPLKEPDLITVDMGGTSFDVSLIRNNKPSMSSSTWFSRYRVATPMLDIHTIGAGGGSIAWVDSGGALNVGPQSAGAVPGPVCYRRGGVEPTVTDANLALGFIDPEYFLAGEMKLDKQAALKSLKEKVGDPLGLESTEAAYGVFRIVNSNMASGIRAVSIQRGYDPRDFVLVAFGGNGAIHSGVLAEELGIKRVIVPRIATAFSARGMLSSNIVINKTKTYIGTSVKYNLVEINYLFQAMKQEVETELPPSARERSQFMGDLQEYYFMDMHYKGELHEITIPLTVCEDFVTDEDILEAALAFHVAHEALHTFANHENPVFIMNLRLQTVIPTSKIPPTGHSLSSSSPRDALRTKRDVCFDAEKGFIRTTIYDGSRLRAGNVVEGPAVIEEPATNVVILPGQAARLDRFDNYDIAIG